MGIIQRQSLKYTVLNVVGMAIGAASTLFIYPLVISEYGFIRFLLDSALLLFPFLSMGMGLTSTRFYADWKDKQNGNHGLLGIILLAMLIASVLFCMLTAIWWPQIEAYYSQKNQAFSPYLWLGVPAAILYSISTVFYTYLQNHQRIAFPSLLMDVLPKISLPIILYSYHKGFLSFESSLYWILAQMLCSLIGVAYFIYTLGDWRLKIDWSFFSEERRSAFMQYAVFSIVYWFAYMFATRADIFFLGSLTTWKTTGVYAIIVFMVSTIEIPTRGLLMASVTKIPAAWSKHDLGEIDALYQKVSTNLLTIGIGLLALLTINYADLVHLMPKGDLIKDLLPIVFLLGSAKLMDMAGGICHAIIYYSRLHKWSLLSLCVLAIGNIYMALFLIPRYGMFGMAVSTLISGILYNLFSMAFVKYQWNLQPITQKTILLVLFGIGTTVFIYFLPLTSIFLVNLAYRSTLFLVVYLGLIFSFRLSPDFQAMIRKYLHGFKA